MSVRTFLYPSRYILKMTYQDLPRRSIMPILEQVCKPIYSKCQIRSKTFTNPTGTPGSGAGRGGGAGGSVRESGGGLGQYGAAQEEQFFYNKQRELLEKLKKKLKEGKAGELSQKEEK